MATPSLKPSVLRFGIFELDYRSGELRRGGVGVKLPPQPFKVLWLLASRPGEVVSREEIREALWGADTFVDFDSGLNFCINQIRRALHDSAESPRFIHTLPKRGYRFLATVEMVRPPLDESEMPDVAVSAPGVALVTRGDEAEAQQVWPVTVERVRPFRWSERAAAPARPLPEGETAADAPRLLPTRRRRAIALALGAVAIAIVAAGIAAFLAARTGSTLPTFRRVTFRRGMVDGARFGADGGIVYSAQWDGAPTELFLGTATVADARRVAPGQLLAVLPSGEMLVRFDREAGPVMAQIPASGGPPRELSDGVSFADWTPVGGGRLALVRQVASEHHLEYPSGHVVYRTGSALSHLRISPDGQRVALFEHPSFGDDRGSVVVIGPEGGRRVLSEGWASVEGLAWSPDGSEVWFTGARVGLDATLHAVTLSGASARGRARPRPARAARRGPRRPRHRRSQHGEVRAEGALPRRGGGARPVLAGPLAGHRHLGRRPAGGLLGERRRRRPRVRRVPPANRRSAADAPRRRHGEHAVAGREVGGVDDGAGPAAHPAAAHRRRGDAGRSPRPGSATTAASDGRPIRARSCSRGGGGRGPCACTRRPSTESPRARSPRWPFGARGGFPWIRTAIAWRSPSPTGRWPRSASTTARRSPSRAACAAIARWRGRRTGNGSTCGAAGAPLIERLAVKTGVREPVVELRTGDMTGAMGPLSPVITPDGRYYAFVYARRLSDLYVVEGLR